MVQASSLRSRVKTADRQQRVTQQKEGRFSYANVEIRVPKGCMRAELVVADKRARWGIATGRKDWWSKRFRRRPSQQGHIQSRSNFRAGRLGNLERLGVLQAMIQRQPRQTKPLLPDTVLTDLGLVERNENNHHADTPARNESRDEKHGDIHRTGLQSGTEDGYQSGQIHGLLPTFRLAHPSCSQGAEDATGREDAIDGPRNGIRVGVVAAQTELGDEAWLAESVRDDGVGVSKGQTPKGQDQDDTDIVCGVRLCLRHDAGGQSCFGGIQVLKLIRQTLTCDQIYKPDTATWASMEKPIIAMSRDSTPEK